MVAALPEGAFDVSAHASDWNDILVREWRSQGLDVFDTNPDVNLSACGCGECVECEEAYTDYEGALSSVGRSGVHEIVREILAERGVL